MFIPFKRGIVLGDCDNGLGVFFAKMNKVFNVPLGMFHKKNYMFVVLWPIYLCGTSSKAKFSTIYAP